MENLVKLARSRQPASPAPFALEDWGGEQNHLRRRGLESRRNIRTEFILCRQYPGVRLQRYNK